MPARWDFRCPDCGFVLRNHVGATPLSDPSKNPRCPEHQFPLGGTLMQWLPAMTISLFSDAATEGGSSFAKFTLPVEDPGSPTGFRDETVASLADIRRLERESLQREANGEGRRMIWRDYSQDATNRDVHTIAPDPSLKAPKHYANGTPVKIRRGAPVVADHGAQEHAPLGTPDHTLQGAGL